MQDELNLTPKNVTNRKELIAAWKHQSNSRPRTIHVTTGQAETSGD